MKYSSKTSFNNVPIQSSSKCTKILKNQVINEMDITPLKPKKLNFDSDSLLKMDLLPSEEYFTQNHLKSLALYKILGPSPKKNSLKAENGTMPLIYQIRKKRNLKPEMVPLGDEKLKSEAKKEKIVSNVLAQKKR